MGPTPDEIEAAAVLARARAEAAALRGRAEVDAEAVRAEAQVDADALRAHAELAAAGVRAEADADREAARHELEGARQRADDLLAEARRQAAALIADADEVRRTGQQTLERLLATRADLHDAIERLTDMAAPVLDITDGATEGPLPDEAAGLGVGASDEVPGAVPGPDEGGAADDERLAPAAALTAVGAPGDDAGTPVPADPVAALVRSAIGRAVDSAGARGRSQLWSSGEPARQREQLRDDRKVL